MPRQVVYGSKYFGGIGLKHLYFEQGCLSIQELIYRLRIQNESSKILQISLQSSHQERGSKLPVLSFPNRTPKLLTKTWATNIWDFMTENNLSLIIPEIQTIPVLRQGDVHLMDLCCSEYKSIIIIISKINLFLNSLKSVYSRLVTP